MTDTEPVEVEPVVVEAAEPPPFAEGFETVSLAQWRQLAAKIVNRRRPEDRWLDPAAAEELLQTRTADGLVIDPLYTAESTSVTLGYPGVMPFVRGRRPLRPDTGWDVRQLHEGPDAAASAKAVLTDLERGVTSLWLTLGADGIAPGDLGTVLADVQLDLAPVCVTSADDQGAAAAALTGVWSQRGLADDAARGNLGLDPLGVVASRGGTPDFGPLLDWSRTCLQRYPQVQAIAVDGRAYHEAGAAESEELAALIATGVQYLRHLHDAGIEAADAFRLIEFRLMATDDQFLTIAKLRALRRLWARVGEVCGVPEPQRGAREHAVTSWRMMSRDDPYVNMLRTTIACFAAAVGGADAITVLPFDAAVGLSDDFSRRLARNTQIVLAEESSLGRVLDPAGGSWYVEALTEDLAKAAWAWFQEIETAGGMQAALESGAIVQRLAAVRAETDTRLAHRTAPITGVSTFPDLTEARLERRERPVLESVPGSVTALPRRRDAQVFERLRDRAQATIERTGAAPTALLLCLGARRDYGTRETFTSSLLAAGGIASTLAEVDSAQAAREAATGAPVAVLCSSPKMYGTLGGEVAQAVRDAGVEHLYLAGSAAELGDDADLLDGTVFAGCDAVDLLSTILDRLGAPEAAPLPTPADPTPQGAGA